MYRAALKITESFLAIYWVARFFLEG